MKNLSLTKAERLSQTKGVKGWAAMFLLLGLMCFDQFILEIPFANIVFPILVICAASMSTLKNVVLIALYAVIFELSCIAWFPADLLKVQWWLLEVFIGYMMPFIAYKLLNRKHKNISVVSYSLIASLGEILYFWVSVIATIILWNANPLAYIAGDLPYQFAGALATFVCALPVSCLYKLYTGELEMKKKTRKAIA